METQPKAPAPTDTEIQGRIDQFHITLEVFEGPFDLLLQLIARKKLDITQVALAEVTDEFIAHMKHFPDLSTTTEFLVVAATLLDMKAAQLLPRIDSERESSAEDLEARDLLFSRLLQYRAFRVASERIAEQLDLHATSFPRTVGIEEPFASLLPDLVWTVTPTDLARSAANALSGRPPTVEVTHLHDPVVPIAPQITYLSSILRRRGQASFRELIEDAETTAIVVSRFLAILELYRAAAIEFSQENPLDTLMLIWVGGSQDPAITLDEDSE